MITVTGTYRAADGTPATGTVTFTPQYVARYDPVPALITQNTVTATLDPEGAFTIELLASDDPDWGTVDDQLQPVPVPYIVREDLAGLRQGWMGYFNGPGPVDVSDVVPLDQAPDVYVPVPGPKGDKGDQGDVGPEGPQGEPGADGSGLGDVVLSGVVSDVVEVPYLGIGLGSKTLNSAADAFAVGDVGKTVVVRNAGPSHGPLITTIAAYVNPTRVTLTDAAGTARDGTTGFFGTDNAAAFQTAAAQMGAGKTLALPEGNYLTTWLPEWRAYESWRGLGPSSSIFWAGAGDAISGVDVRDSTLADFRLVGPARGMFNPAGLGDPVYPATADGIHATKTGAGASTAALFYLNLSGLTIEQFSRDGISLDTPIVSKIERCVIFKTGRHGVYLYGTGESAGTSTHLDAVFAAGCYEAGFYIKQMAYCTLSSCAADANGIGYWYNNTLGLTEDSCGTEEPYDFFALGFTASDYARGYSRRIMNGKVTQNAPYMIGNIGVAQYVTDVSRMVINVFYEGSPGAGAVSSLKVDAGCVVTLNESHIVTPMDLAPGTTVSLRGSAWDGTQAQYDALGTYDPATTYYVAG